MKNTVPFIRKADRIDANCIFSANNRFSVATYHSTKIKVDSAINIHKILLREKETDKKRNWTTYNKSVKKGGEFYFV